MPMRRAGAAARTMLEQAAANAVGRAGRRGARGEPRRHARRLGPHARLRRAGQGRGRAAGAGARHRAAQGPVRLPLHRQGQIGLIDNRRHHHRQGRSTASTRGSTARSSPWSRARRCSAARSRSFDGAEAMKVPGVLKVVPIDPPAIPSEFQPLGGVAVVARNTWAAMKGRDALQDHLGRRPATPSYSSDTYQASLEEAARKPGKVVRNEGDVDARHGRRCEDASRRSTTSPTSRKRRWSRRRRWCASWTGACEAWACVQSPQATRDPPRGAPRHPRGQGDGERHAARRRLRPQVEARLRGRGRASAARRWTARRCKLTWTREDDLHNGYYHTVSVERMEAGLDAARQAGGLAAPERRAHHRLDLRAGPEARAALRAGHGAGQHALRHPEHPGGEPGSGGAHPHRLVPLGVQHPARLRRPVLRGGAGARGGARPEGLPAGADRPGRGSSTRPRSATPGTTARTRSSTRSTPAACAA